MRCPNCGAENPDSAVFCSLCLARFDEPEDVSAVAEPESGLGPARKMEQPQDPSTTEAGESPHPAAADNIGVGAEATSDDWGDVSWSAGSGEAGGDDTDAPATAVGGRDHPPLWLKPWFVVTVLLAAVVVVIGWRVVRTRQDQVGTQQQVLQEQLARQQEPSAQSPGASETQPTTQPQGSPQSAAPAPPEVAFTPPSGWSVSSLSDGYLLSSAEASGTMELRFWKRQPGGQYFFVDSNLQATSETSARSELSSAVLKYLYGSNASAGGVASSTQVNGAWGASAELRSTGTQGGSYRKAVGLVHGDWTYLISCSGPMDRKSALVSAMDTLLRSISFTQSR